MMRPQRAPAESRVTSTAVGADHRRDAIHSAEPRIRAARQFSVSSDPRAFSAPIRRGPRCEPAAILAEREQVHRDEAELNQLSSLAARALAGEFGSDEKKLAALLLLDERGRCATELSSLREFKRALIQLKRER